MQNQKYELSNDLDYVSELYINGKQNEINEYLNNKNIVMDQKIDGTFIEIRLTKKVKLITPLLNKILSNPYEISVKRSVYYE